MEDIGRAAAKGCKLRAAKERAGADVSMCPARTRRGGCRRRARSPLPDASRSRFPHAAMPITVSDRFDSGAIEFLSASPDGRVELALRADSHADFRQWFHFRLQGARGLPLTLSFVNAGACTYVEGWRDYRVVASYDRRHWFRIDTTFDGQRMVAAHVPETRQRLLRVFRALPGGAPPRTPRARRRHAARPRVAAGRQRRGARRRSRHRRRGEERTRSGLGDRAPAPRGDDGRVVRRGAARPAGRS